MGGFEAVLLLACLLAALWDFLYWEIPNEIIVFLILLFLVKTVVASNFSHALIPVLFAACVLVVGFVLYYFKLLGPGDSKLIAVCTLWFAPEHFWLFLFAMALFGGVLGVLYYYGFAVINTVRMGAVRWLKSTFVKFPVLRVGEMPEPPMKEQAVIPYGVAIFCGAVVACIIET